MKKRIAPPVLLFTALIVLIALVSCSNNPGSDHSHKFTFDESKWERDETDHWHLGVCECGEEKKVDITAHTFGDETTTTGTCLVPGTKSKSCTVCEYKNITEKTSEKLNHTFNTASVPICTSCGGYKCGDNVAGVYNASTKTLTVTGTGAMDEKYTWGVPNGSISPWYEDACYITSVIIEDGVTSVSKFAFADDENIEKVTLGKDVKELGNSSFRSTNITSIIFPEGLEKIGSLLFDGTKITELNIPSKVVITSEDFFWDIESLASINIDPDNTSAVSIDGVVYSKDKSTIICVLRNKTGYSIPEGIKKIGDYSFYSWKGTEIVIPSSVTEICEGAFEDSELTKVKFNEGLKTIAGGAFDDSKITKAELPSTVETIGDGAFATNTLKEINIGSAIQSIGSNAFYSCEDITITINRPSSAKDTLCPEENDWMATNATVVWSDTTST